LSFSGLNNSAHLLIKFCLEPTSFYYRLSLFYVFFTFVGLFYLMFFNYDYGFITSYQTLHFHFFSSLDNLIDIVTRCLLHENCDDIISSANDSSSPSNVSQICRVDHGAVSTEHYCDSGLFDFNIYLLFICNFIIFHKFLIYNFRYVGKDDN